MKAVIIIFPCLFWSTRYFKTKSESVYQCLTLAMLTLLSLWIWHQVKPDKTAETNYTGLSVTQPNTILTHVKPVFQGDLPISIKLGGKFSWELFEWPILWKQLGNWMVGSKFWVYTLYRVQCNVFNATQHHSHTCQAGLSRRLAN